MSKINENQDVVVNNDLGRKRVTIRVERDGDSTVELETGVWNYGAIVSALVRAKYSADDIEAITNNNIALLTMPSAVSSAESEEDREEKLAEFRKMQEWRSKCKERARELISIGKSVGLADEE
nr:MAG TPA: hypothetical protein [Caudoviricetes sp.]